MAVWHIVLADDSLIAGFESAKVSYERGDYANSFPQMLRIAENGVAEAQIITAMMFLTGEGVNGDLTVAADWVRRAAEQDLPSAQSMLGSFYYNGIGVKQDYYAAALWYLRAARNGSAGAQSALGTMYANGEGVQKNVVEATKWLQMAYSDNVEAAYHLGELYRTDTSIGPDLQRAATYYRVAANGGHSLAQFRIATLYYEGTGVSQDFGRAARYTQSAANQDLPDAQFLIGYMYLRGEGVSQDYAAALNYLGKASGNGYLSANLHIGDMYAQGLGVEQNLHEAFKWYNQAVQRGASREFIATAKKSRDAVARLAKIKIEPNIVPMDGSGLLTLYEGRLIEYDPVLSDFDVAQDGTVDTQVFDWWQGGRPKRTYVSQNRRKPRIRRQTRNTVNDDFDFGTAFKGFKKNDFDFGTPSYRIGYIGSGSTRSRSKPTNYRVGAADRAGFKGTGSTNSRSSAPGFLVPIGAGVGYDPVSGTAYGGAYSMGTGAANGRSSAPLILIPVGGGHAVDSVSGKVYPGIGNGLHIDPQTGQVVVVPQ